LSIAVWCWLESIPISPYSLPYTAQSPVTYEPRTFETVEDIWSEIELLEQENTKWSSGQNLFHVVPLFADISLLLESWMWDAIQEYQYQKWTNLGELDCLSLGCGMLSKNINIRNGQISVNLILVQHRDWITLI